MSEHPILRAIQEMCRDYEGSPGVEGAAPMEITLHGGPPRSGFANVYNGLVSFKQFQLTQAGSRWSISEFSELINPDFIVSIVDVERWPDQDET